MSTFLLALKVLGIIILILLAIVLFIFLTVLIVPVRYSIEGEKYAEIKGGAKVTWLFKVLNAAADFADGKLSYKVKVFGRVFLDSEEEVKEEMPSEDMTADKTEPEEKASVKEIIFDDGNNAETKALDEEEVTAAEADAEKRAAEERKRFEEYKQSRKKAVVRRVKMKDIAEVAETSEEAKAEENAEENKKEPQKIDKDYFIKMPWEEKKRLIGCAYRLIKRVLKGVLPKDFYLDAKIGTGDPSTTGYVLAAAGIVKGTVFENVNITADFEKAFFEGGGKIKGKITIGYLLYCALCFALAKPIRKIIIIFLKGRGVKK